jgi:hypothetical protein
MLDPNLEKPSEADYRQLVDLALRSETFQNAPTSRALLQYLYDHRSEQISEYAIGTEALGRRAEFDPRTDSYARVQISRLRTKIIEFTAKEGERSPVQMVLPRGSHTLEFVDRPFEENNADSESVSTPVPNAPKTTEKLRSAPHPVHSSSLKPDNQAILIRSLVLAVGVLVVLLACSLLWQWKQGGWKAGSAIIRANAGDRSDFAPDSFWGRSLGSGRPIRIVVPNLTFFLWVDPKTGEKIHVRSVDINEFSQFEHSALLSELERKYGHPPSLSQEYLSTYDALSAFNLALFLRDNGVSPSFSNSAESPLGMIDHENLILMGTSQTLKPYQNYLKDITLSFNPVLKAIQSTDPATGKVTEYPPVAESNERIVIPQVLACLPTNSPEGRLLVIEGYKEIAIISYLTSRDGQEELKRLQAANRGNPFFEAVVMSEINGDTPLQSQIAYYKAIVPGR